MFPNPQDALPLPPRPDLEQYKKRAKDLIKASSDPVAIRNWAEDWIESLVRLSDLTITPQLPVRIETWIDQLAQFARTEMSASRTVTHAQFVIARAHGFESWPKLTKHLAALSRANSPVSNFELGADAIVAGDALTLERLLRDDPALIRTRSSRQHQATLLHYVSANGVEGYRQKTPPNIVPIAEILLRAGAEINATAEVYGGGHTTLGLVATSVHPERAGVQEALMQLLLDHGATFDGAIASSYTRGLLINACLSNGRGLAAEFLARQGAPLDLEGAAGVGRLDVVKTFFDANGNVNSNATRLQMERGFLWACEYGRNAIVEFLLQRGVALHVQANTGQTALHWAVIGGHVDTIKLLLNRGANLESKNIYGGTALGQALWSAIHSDSPTDYAPLIETLLKAGAHIEDGSLAWLTKQEGLPPATKLRLTDLLKHHGALT